MSHILIVEDDAEIRQIWADALTMAGNVVAEAQDGVEAIKQLALGRYDLVIFDLFLPRLSGLEVIKLIRRTETDLPIMVITGGSDSSLEREALEAGVNEVFLKPMHLDNLCATVARLTQSKSKHSV
jgi:two-component system response regulator MprA